MNGNKTVDGSLFTRRKMVSIGTGLLAGQVLMCVGGTGLATAAPQGIVPIADQQGAVGMRNPLTEYPGPPFKPQHQDPPGLACKMDPRPDHGETSYKGSGKLKGRKALITGGDSGIGRATAIAFAREGADVAFGYLPVEEPDAKDVVQLIEAEGRKALPLPGDIRDEAFCQKLVADAVDGLGGLDILMSNAAKQVYQESILDISTEQFDATFRTNVYAMFWITKAGNTGLRNDQRSDCDLRQGAFQAVDCQRDSRERRGAGPDLDTAST
jgi:hypothetical protein